jgi:hypothetical protein
MAVVEFVPADPPAYLAVFIELVADQLATPVMRPFTTPEVELYQICPFVKLEGSELTLCILNPFIPL